MADHPDIAYLKSDDIGKVLAQGLAEVYRVKPTFPVDYFSRWLLNYSKEQKNLKALEENRQRLIQERQKYEEVKLASETTKIEQEKAKEMIIQEKEHLKELIDNAEYHDELIEKVLPEGVFKFIKATGCYVGFHEYPFKEIDQDDETIGEGDHLNMDLGKVITYIGGDEGSRKFMLNKTLPPEGGVTNDLFTAAAGEAQPVDPEEGELDDEEPRNSYIYIKDVATDPRMHFFEIPRFGSYMAVPMKVNSYLNALTFENGLEKTREYKKNLEENELKIKEIQEDFDEKIAKAKEDENEEELEAIMEEYNSYEWPTVECDSFATDVKNYVFCVDTLGKDQEISQEDRDFIESICRFFVTSWEKKELEYIKQDIERYIAYDVEHNEDILEAFQKAEEKEADEVEGDFEEGQELKEAYAKEEARLNIVRDQLLNEEESKNHLMALKEYRFIKYKTVIQNALILIGYKKEDINEPGTNQLNWRKVRVEYFNDEFIEKVLAYKYKGEKKEEVAVYNYINRICDRFAAIPQQEVDTYNLGLGRLLRYLTLVTSLRVKDIELRKQDRIARREARETAIREKQEREDRRVSSLEEAKEENEEEEFNEEEWLNNWDHENPEIEIPDEVQDEIDVDLEPEEEEEAHEHLE